MDSVSLDSEGLEPVNLDGAGRLQSATPSNTASGSGLELRGGALDARRGCAPSARAEAPPSREGRTRKAVSRAGLVHFDVEDAERPSRAVDVFNDVVHGRRRGETQAERDADAAGDAHVFFKVCSTHRRASCGLFFFFNFLWILLTFALGSAGLEPFSDEKLGEIGLYLMDEK